MSSQVKVLPHHLRSLSQQMRRANSQSLGFIASGIKTIKNNNAQVASMRESRINIVRDTMMDRMDLVGLQALTSSFSASYNQMETNKPLLNRAIDQTLPTMMEQRFFSVNRFSLPNNINDTRWSVGGRRWETEAGSLQSLYNTISLRVANIVGQVDDQLTVLDNFSKRGHYTRGIGPAANAFYSILSHISEEMIRPIPEGTGSSRSGSMDGIPDTVANVVDVLERHVELASAKSEETATQVHALADDREAFENLATNLFTNEVNNIHHESLIRNSQVELALYRPELLSDGMGIESAKEAQHEQRFEALKAGLIQHFFPIVDYLASQEDLFITNIPQLCEEAVREIDRWLTLLSLQVTVEVRVEHEGTVQGAPLTRWESKPISTRLLGDYIPETMDDIRRARDILNRWGDAFRITIRRARELRDAINRNDHIGPLAERIERALYLPDTYDILQTFATQAREHLENLATAYQGGANQLRSHMSGNTVTACTREIDSIAKYFRAIAQAIEKDFGNGNFSGGVNKLSTFPVRSSTRLAWGRKTLEERIAYFFNENGDVDLVRLAQELLAPGTYREDFSQAEWETVLAIFSDERVSPDNLALLLQLMMLNPRMAMNDPRIRPSEQTLRFELLSHDATNRMMGQILGVNPNNSQWPSTDQTLELFRRISLGLMEYSGGLTHQHIWGYPRPNENDVFATMRRAQLVAFLGSLDRRQVQTGIFDFSSFDRGGPGDFTSNVPGYITLSGRRYFVSGWSSLSGSGFAGEHRDFLSYDRRRGRQDAVPDMTNVAVEGASLFATLFSSSLPIGVSGARTAHSNTSSTANFINTVHQAWNRDAIIAAIGADWELEQFTVMANELGGSVNFIETPNGHILMSNTPTQRAIINEAFFASQPDLELHLGSRQFRHNHITGEDTVALNAFRRSLENNFALLPQELLSRYPHVNNETELNDLPEAILRELVNMR